MDRNVAQTIVEEVAGDVTPALDVARFNAMLRGHACAKAQWGLHDLAAQFYGWAERFNAHLSLNVTTPAIAIQPIQRRALGTFRYVPNGFGIDDEIVINSRRLNRPYADVLRTLLHEMLHQWQHRHGHPGKSNHHNQEFRDKALALGLPCDARGRSLGIIAGSPFEQMLQTFGIGADTRLNILGSEAGPAPGSKLKKWSCGCTNVRCAVELLAGCERCGKPFKRAPS